MEHTDVGLMASTRAAVREAEALVAQDDGEVDRQHANFNASCRGMEEAKLRRQYRRVLRDKMKADRKLRAEDRRVAKATVVLARRQGDFDELWSTFQHHDPAEAVVEEENSVDEAMDEINHMSSKGDIDAAAELDDELATRFKDDVVFPRQGTVVHCMAEPLKGDVTEGDIRRAIDHERRRSGDPLQRAFSDLIRNNNDKDSPSAMRLQRARGIVRLCHARVNRVLDDLPKETDDDQEDDHDQEEKDDESRRLLGMLYGEDSSSDTESDDEVDDESETDDDRVLWHAVERCAMEALRREERVAEAVQRKPRTTSSDDAWYNPWAHLSAMQSPAARAEHGALGDAVCSCNLRRRPDWDEGPGVQRPLEIRASEHSVENFDFDDGLGAADGMYGYYKRRAYTAALQFPVPRLPATTLSDLEDPRGINVYDNGNQLFRRLAPVGCGGVLADSRGGKIWCGDENDGSFGVVALSVRRKAAVARLTFPEAVQRVIKRRRRSFWSSTMTRLDDRIIAATATSYVYAWSIDAALDANPFDLSPKDLAKERDGSSSSTAPAAAAAADVPEPEAKRLKSDPGAEIFVGDKYAVGDVEALDKARIVVAPSDLSERTPTSLRVVDVAAASVVRVMAGFSSSHPKLVRQHCAASQNLVFASAPDTALIFDLRTSKPVLTLAYHPTPVCLEDAFRGHNHWGVLGVPTGTVAFTWSGQHLRAFDLRRPAAHAYTFDCDGYDLKHLAWHHTSAALIAACDLSCEDGFDSGLGCAFLQFPFDDGLPIHHQRT